jgi:hypothetical protein
LTYRGGNCGKLVAFPNQNLTEITKYIKIQKDQLEKDGEDEGEGKRVDAEHKAAYNWNKSIIV